MSLVPGSITFGWLSRDGKLLITASSVQAFGHGLLSVSLGVYLAQVGLNLVQIGAYFTAGGLGLALIAVAVTLTSERVGRKALLVGLTLMASLALAALIVTDQLVLLAIFAFLGAMSGSAGGPQGATQPLVQASLAHTSTPRRRTDTFATFRIANTFARALGALAAGIPVLLASALGISEVAAFKATLILLIAMIGGAALLYALLSPAAVPATQGGWTNPFRLPSRRKVFLLTGLFTVDSLGGALLIQSLVAYWFYTKFGIDVAVLSFVFFGSEILTAISMWFATRIATRIGLLNTMVFTHIPASLFLIGAAFAPFGWLAIALWQARAFFSQMDVPTRDSYTMAIVGPEERVAMASMHQLGRSGATAVGPYLSTAMWMSVSASAPFVACGVIKIGYDLALWAVFHNVRTEEEATRMKVRPPV